MSVFEALVNVRGILLRDIDEVDLGLIRLGPAKAGSPVTLPAGLFRILMKRGLVDLLEGEKIGPDEVLKRYWIENKSAELRELPKDFYIRVRLTLDSMGNSENGNGRALLNQVKTLAQLRLRKILTSLVMNVNLVDSREFLDRLTYEEEFLVKLITPLIKGFFEEILDLK